MIPPNEHLLQIVRIAERMEDRAHAVRLDRNERVTPFPQEVFREMLASLRPESFCAYPDTGPLYDRLGRHLRIPTEYLYLTNGSDAAIRMAFQTYVRPGDTIVFPDPTYAMYGIYTRMFQGRARTVPYDVCRRLDVAQVFRLLGDRPRMLALANPDQPTGAVLTETVLRQLVSVAREAGILFIIDEAYHPFYPRTALPMVCEFDNLVVTRSFSKVGGLAGLRLGYMAAHPEIISNIQRTRGAHEVNAIAIAIGSYVLDHPELGAAHLAEVQAGRKVLAAVAQELGLGFPECPTNFQLMCFPEAEDTTALVLALKQRGYLVKGGFTSPSVRSCIRVTLGGPGVMQGFAEVLRSVVSIQRSRLLV